MQRLFPEYLVTMRWSNVTCSRLAVASVAAFAFASCSSDEASDTTTSTVAPSTSSTTPTSATAPTAETTGGTQPKPAMIPETFPEPTLVGGAPAPTADPSAPPQVGPIDPGMTMSSDSVVTSIFIPDATTATTTFKP
ncbi:MAG: hypothetical protein JWN39_827 [Ilumatobacteraceae bacterium]|nr:hypothetical protein [Ilumatobacteraceae bacterium]